MKTICVAGKNELAANCLEWVCTQALLSDTRIVACCNQSDSGVDTYQRSFLRVAKLHNVPRYHLNQLYELRDMTFFSLEFDRIINPDKFCDARLFNIHFSLLPRYKGMYTSAWPLLNGDTYTGVTLHEIDHGIDTGNIIDQIEFSIGDDQNCRDLYFSYTKYGIQLFKRNFKELLCGLYSSYAQPWEGASYYSRNSIDYTNLHINLKKTAYQIRNQVRAFNFREYQIPTILSYEVVAAKILESTSKMQPGTMLNDTTRYFDIATMDYDLRLIKDSQCR